jgi:hypothetical protein
MEQFKVYMIQRIVLGVLFVLIALWGISFLIGFFTKPTASDLPRSIVHSPLPIVNEAHTKPVPDVHSVQEPATRPHETESAPSHTPPIAESHQAPAHAEPSKEAPAAAAHPPAAEGHGAKTTHGSGHGSVESPSGMRAARGVEFVTAAIKPLDYELNGRFWGWRPNDIINFTDNVNNFQLGVLEVTRRTVVVLAERISRRGSNDEFNRNVENSMNWLMIKPETYWFPTPESKYNDALDELRKYMDVLKQGKATFYTRTDNLIPLLQVFEDLMGSCEENLVKEQEKNGDHVSFFKADDYFYYAKGVADAMLTIMEAVKEDFGQTIESRRGGELIETIIEECHRAKEIDPWFVINGDYSGFFANHRANMAAPIAGARYMLGQLIITLST